MFSLGEELEDEKEAEVFKKHLRDTSKKCGDAINDRVMSTQGLYQSRDAGVSIMTPVLT